MPSPATSEAIPAAAGLPAEGELLGGKLRIERVLGAGGMGVVFAARDEQLGRRVAVKLLRPELARRKDAAARFLREAQATVAIHSEHVARVLEIGSTDAGLPYIVMEHLTGIDLGEHVRLRGPLPVADAVDYVLQACEAVAEAHALGIVHRDLKPSNLFLTRRGGAPFLKVLDFGIAKIARPAAYDGRLTSEGAAMGSPAYMAPEQIRDSSTVDARADIWALGVILHELLTGSPPFAAATPEAMCASVAADPPPSLRGSRPEVPEALAALVVRCLAKSPDDRVQDVAELAAGLAPFAPDGSRPAVDRMLAVLGMRSNDDTLPIVPQGAAARPRAEETAAPSEVAPAAPGAARRRLRRAIPAVVAVAIVAAGSAALWGGGRTDAPAADGADALAAASSNPALAAYEAGRVALRDGAWPEGIASLERAVALDPTLAAVHLRLAFFKLTFYPPTEVRASFEQAVRHRASLGPRDRELLEVVAALVQQQPYDIAECEKRLSALAARHDDDAELALWLGLIRGSRGAFEGALAAYDHALALDPGQGLAWSGRIVSQIGLGDLAGARLSAERCVQSSPTAAACAHERAVLLDLGGECAALETTARAWLRTGQDAPRAYDALAWALLAQGRPREAVHEVLRQKWARLPESLRAATAAGDEMRLALVAGELAIAEEKAREMILAAAASADELVHADAAWTLVAIAAETGRAAEASRLAEDFLRRRSAWSPDPTGDDGSVWKDVTGRMLATRLHAGSLSRAEHAARRDAWATALEASTHPGYRPFLWATVYADPAETREEAEEALAALSLRGPPPRVYWYAIAEASVGKVHTLAGRHDEAIPYLTRATSACRPMLDDPLRRTWALASLGMAQEGRGDREKACAAYEAVLARWGSATPRSLTAERARDRAKRLACGRGR